MELRPGGLERLGGSEILTAEVKPQPTAHSQKPPLGASLTTGQKIAFPPPTHPTPTLQDPWQQDAGWGCVVGMGFTRGNASKMPTTQFSDAVSIVSEPEMIRQGGGWG